MDRKRFLKFLLGLPFGPLLAQKIQQKEHRYLLNKFYVAGFQYYSGPSLMGEIETGEELNLITAPGNYYDKFAVEIHRKDMLLGHIPRTDNKHISRLLQQDVKLSCVVTEVNPDRETWKMLKVEIYL
ncbi:MAG TPA: HIRAN domain-containing protein [Balneolaceae bacterium]